MAVGGIALKYWHGHCAPIKNGKVLRIPSAEAQKIALRYISEYFCNRTLSELTIVR